MAKKENTRELWERKVIARSYDALTSNDRAKIPGAEFWLSSNPVKDLSPSFVRGVKAFEEETELIRELKQLKVSPNGVIYSLVHSFYQMLLWECSQKKQVSRELHP